MQPDRHRTAGLWLNGAAQDIAIARAGMALWPSAACFHAQQAAEKALSAALVVRCGDVVRTHALTVLEAELREAGVDADERTLGALRTLDKYYAPTRYPDALGDVDPTTAFTESEAIDAIERAECVIAFAKGLVDEDR
ncbi:MAG: HEPN domain-containing protein [Candidatus Baltobacteraceae bacterium]